MWPHPHPYSNVWPEGGVVLHVKECFIVVSYNAYIQSFSFITNCPYYNVWPGAVYCCFNKNYIQGLQHFKYDVARLASEPNMSAKFHGLVLFGL